MFNAVTEEPFKEHTYYGKTYVEVEPGAEYFIQVTSQSEEEILWIFYVDGESLGYWSHQEPGESHINGIFSHRDGRKSNTALKFARVQAQYPVSNTLDNQSLWTGQVKAEAYKAIFSHDDEEIDDYAADFKEGDIRCDFEGSKKSVMSTKGTITESQNVISRTSYKEGDLVDTFELNYCTALGLINVGVLPKPPAWDYLRMQKPFNQDTLEGGKELNIEPIKVRFEDAGGNFGAKEYDLFDLSHISDVDSDDDIAPSQDT
mmetsp:Transcript_11210/g.15080  ORF Transcript_11210/g.15080 Transcript_11210/m.15080 type:complete len:260 (+) Transcript_11210:15-794(+)